MTVFDDPVFALVHDQRWKGHRSGAQIVNRKDQGAQKATCTDVERTKSAFAYFCAKSMREAVERFSIYCFRLISAKFCTT